MATTIPGKKFERHIFIKSKKTSASWLWDKSEEELVEYMKKHPEIVRVTPENKSRQSVD